MWRLIRRALLVTVVVATLALSGAGTTNADGPDFSAFSRSWYAHLMHLVIAEDGSGIALYTQLGRPELPANSVTFLFDSISDDGNTLYGSVISTSEPSRWYRQARVSLSFASPHTAYLQQTGNIVFLCSSGWLDEVPSPPCGA